MRRSILLALVALTAVSVLALAGTAQAAPAAKTLRGTVGPGFTITVAKKSVKAGRYTIVIRDRSSIHNWHIKGPGVNKKTSVARTGTFTFKNVRLRKGTYTIVCDPHRSTMRTTLRVR